MCYVLFIILNTGNIAVNRTDKSLPSRSLHFSGRRDSKQVVCHNGENHYEEE